MSTQRTDQRPSPSTFGTVVLFAALLSLGVLAGFFFTYAHTIMPGLGATDDRTFVTVYQQIESAVSGGAAGPGGFNWTVMLTFFGGAVLTTGALVLNRSRPMVGWIIAALVLHIASMVSTMTFNVPLNNEILAAGDPAIIDVAQVRVDFREGWWQTWNWVRSATTIGAFGCLAWALYLKGAVSGLRGGNRA